jgi:hypothetical protein
MKVGTRSVLFGYHQFILHPLFVAIAWWKLFGFPRDPRLWVAFFVHDLGYWGKPNMDGPEGEQHPFVGARIMSRLFDRHIVLRFDSKLIGMPPLAIAPWYCFTLYHSRFLAKAHLHKPSRLCIADKYAILIVPIWLQVLLTSLTGEIHEYMRGHNGRTSGAGMSRLEWVEQMRTVIRAWMREHHK